MSDLKTTPLNALHHELGGKMVPFAGYELPVQYPMGVLREHQHCRAEAGLFDVSHMGQIVVRGRDCSLALETLVPVDVHGLKEGRQRYAVFTDARGGILDDLMIANRGDHLLLVVNAACKDADLAHLQSALPPGITAEPVLDRALLALQGPAAEAALATIVPKVAKMKFMDVAILSSDYGHLWISRSGYTGEDGFEVSVDNGMAEPFARALLAQEAVEPVGLGARDSLRLEAGLCLYGHDMDTGTTPVEASLSWAIQKVRRTGGEREGGFPGAETILPQLSEGAGRRRVGLRPEGRAPIREGVELYEGTEGGDALGRVTSGGFAPTVGAPVAMGYVPTEFAGEGTTLYAELRGKRVPVAVAAMPFRPSTYKR